MSKTVIRVICIILAVMMLLGVIAALFFLFSNLGTLPLVLLAGVVGYAVCEVRSR